MAKPNYVATKSAWSAVTFLRVIFFWLIIPLIIMIVDILVKKSEKIEFYDDYIIHKKGVLSKSERRFAFVGVAGVSVTQSFWQRIFKFGDVYVDVIGMWDLNTDNIKDPNGLKNFLENRMVKQSGVQAVIAN